MFLCNKGRDKLPGGTEYKLSQGKIFCPKQTTQGDSQIILMDLGMISEVSRCSVRGRYSYSRLSCKPGSPAVPRAMLVR